MIGLPSAEGWLAYVFVALASAIEGEIVFVAASALVSQGKLSASDVAIAGSIGAALGDQFYFYLFRNRLKSWLDKMPAIGRRAEAFSERVRRHQTLMVFAIRFSPGFRVALTAACAHAKVPALKFSLINLASAVVWAIGLLLIIAYGGPAWFERMGISGWKSVLIPAVLVLLLLHGKDLWNLATRRKAREN